ncbi:MAG: sodium:proton antiporter, partial [Bacteroidaceae bacterium]|nr:sodium:proton antiporter [Bacteroidaceae bacterium]
GSQTALLLASGVCFLLARMRSKQVFADYERVVCEQIGKIGAAIIILIFIGALSGVWMVSGIVPELIYYGIHVIHPKLFLICTCVICAIVSLMVGSSWTTIATVGVALIGIGEAQGFSHGWIAGAIISGAYFGDKMSPLSDTTVLASSMSDVPLFKHIRYMMITTVPTVVICLLVFGLVGITHEPSQLSLVGEYTTVLDRTFNLSPWLLLVPVFTGYLIYRKMPSIMVLFLSTLAGAVAAVAFQPHILAQIAGMEVVNAESILRGILQSVYTSTHIETGNETINNLISSRGMAGMLDTIWLILCAMCFGGCMSASGMLEDMGKLLTAFTKRRASLVTSTVATGICMNCTVADQFLSIILTSNIFKKMYTDNGYEGRLMSRAIEDSATATSPLIPWSTCGMTQSAILGIPTLVYFPYCLFCIISPLMSIAVAVIGYKIRKITNP